MEKEIKFNDSGNLTLPWQDVANLNFLFLNQPTHNPQIPQAKKGGSFGMSCLAFGK